MAVLHSTPRGRIGAARLTESRDEMEEAYGIIIRPAGVMPAREPLREARPPRPKGGEG